MDSYTIQGNIVDISNRVISLGEIMVQNGVITSISIPNKGEVNPALPFISPGFIDAHVHIESSM